MSDSEFSESFAGQEGYEEQHAGPPQTTEQMHTQQHTVAGATAFGELAASSSTSGGDSSVSSTSSEDESDENESENSLELTKITSEVLSLPRGLCESAEVFHEFFSLDTWHQLPVQIQNHLQQFLPNFSQLLPPQIAAVEQARTLSMLFTGELQRFGQSPLALLQQQLEAGNCRPDIKKLRENIKKSQKREMKFRNCERLSHMAKRLFLSRQRLLDHANKSLPESMVKATPSPSTSVRQPKPAHLYRDNKLSAIRARKRFYCEISQIAQDLGMGENFALSADEDDEDNKLNEEMRKDLLQQQRSVDENAEPPKANIALAERCVYSTVFWKRADVDDEEAFRFQQRSRQSRLSNHNFKEYLREHKRRKMTEPTLPELETSDIRLRDVCARAQMGNFKRVLGAGKPGRKPKSATAGAASSSSLQSSSHGNTTIEHSATGQNRTSLPVISQLVPLASKLSEPPALVPIQPITKKSDIYQSQISGTMLPPSSMQQHPQQTAMEMSAFAKGNNHMQNPPNDSLNMSSFMSAHGDNLNLCMDESSLLTGDHDAFNMLDSEVELQQEEVVETFASSSDDNLPNFVLSDDMVMGSRNETSILHTPQKVDAGGRRIIHGQQQQQQQPIPKLEPIMRNSDASPKLSLKAGNSQKSPSISSLSALNCSSELIQETHASYFSLIRDFFCSTPHHRMRYDDLKSKIDIWLRNPITALNEWYSYAGNWSNLLGSAINFLVGDFPDLPDEYVPYIEHKVPLNIYQWIGAGRDSDTRLTELCNLWMDRRKHPNENPSQLSGNQMGLDIKLEVLPRSIVESEDAADAAAFTPPPPPPRCPTNWTVRAATEDEIIEFQRQERERFERPHKAYTYQMHGYESVVGPVKGIYTPMLALAKARGHSMMVGDRPNFVTILTLVRDATARLPNGEGTRADISELLKCSQYINPDAAENVLQTIVSGALDRMHTEHDPCVRYDPKRKIWIYLHRNRTEEEFEKIHQQNQTVGKTKKLQQRKTRPFAVNATCNKLNSPDQEGGSLLDAANGTLLTMPALVPANPIIVSNSAQRQQQQHLQHHQQIQLNKCPPVPPLKYNIPSTSGGQAQQQQKSLLKTIVRPESKIVTQAASKQHSFQMPQAKANAPSNTTPIIVATPQGLQTVHVSNATSVMSSNSSNQQQQQQTSAVQQTNLTANLAGKRVMLNKPIIINQITNQQTSTGVPNSATAITSTTPKHKSPQQVVKQQNRITLSQQQQHQLQQQSNIITIPISMANAANATDQANTSQASSNISSFSGKQNIIRILPASNVKTILTSSTAQVVNRQRIVSASNLSTGIAAQEQRSNTQQQQQKTGFQILSSSGNVVTINNAGRQVTAGSASNAPAGSIVKMSAQAFAALHQKQVQQQQQVTQQQHMIMKQSATIGTKMSTGQTISALKTQRVIVGNSGVVGQTTQGKNVVLHQIPVGASSVVVTPTTSTTVVSASATSLSGGNKIQTINTSNLTPQQQRILIQNLKQQQQQQQNNVISQNPVQYKTVQVVGSSVTTSQQQTIIQRPQTITVAAAAPQPSTPKTVVMVPHDSGGSQQHPQQTITRILKTSPQLKSETASSTTSRVITSSSGQIISLDSLIQKQGGALRITGTLNPTGTVKTNAGQQLNTTILQKPQQQQHQQPKQQQQQYAIVSVPNSIISLSNSGNFTVGQRIITTQAAASGSFNTSMVNVDNTKVTPGIVSAGGQRRIVTTTSTAGGTKIITKAGNVNVGTLQGKQVVLASGKTVTAINKAQLSNQQQQNVVQTTAGGIVIGGQTIKLQPGNSNIQHILNKGGNIVTAQSAATTTTQSTGGGSGQMQTVIMGNQILRVQQLPQIVTAGGANAANRLTTANVINKAGNIGDGGISSAATTPKTIFLGSSGQTLRLQSATGQTSNNKNVIVNTNQQSNATAKTSSGSSSGASSTPNRLVLAVQGGGQIFLSPNFQSGGNINLKTLQNLKMVPLAQAKDQQQTATSIQTQPNILKISPSSHHSTASDANV
uniref:DEUBAD domain-containing protein n=1 Tax=Stomoxys calcitrans TaxID=35570 RepID=A0A1I8NRC0_STOCA